VILGDGAHRRYVTSVPLGCARLAQRFIRHDPPRPEEVDALDRYVRRAWVPVARAVRRLRWDQALGSSATIEQLMTAAYIRIHHRRPKEQHRLSISQRSLRQLLAWLSTSTAAERRQLPGLDPRREDLALTTGVALLAWMEGCGVSTLHYAPGSLREGLVIDYLIRNHLFRVEPPGQARGSLRTTPRSVWGDIPSEAPLADLSRAESREAGARVEGLTK
jgi:exopolyphosphatase/guanosine-5'-triphosphate,3'-diphosphate pyrophosphatase